MRIEWMIARKSLFYSCNFCFQLAAKISLVYRYECLITTNIDRIIYIYEINAKTKSEKRALLMQKISQISECLFIGGLIVYFVFTSLHFLNPIYGYFWQHEFKPLFPLYLPFVDEKTTAGFTILISIQIVEIFISVLSSASADFPYMIMVINVWIFSSVFEENVSELNDVLRAKKVDELLVKAKLRNIFGMYCDIRV